MAIQWNGNTRVGMPSISQTGFADAGKIFGNINEQLSKDAENALLAENRRAQLADQQARTGLLQDQFAYEQGAPERAVQAEAAQFKLGKERNAALSNAFNASRDKLLETSAKKFRIDPNNVQAAIDNSEGISGESLLQGPGQASPFAQYMQDFRADALKDVKNYVDPREAKASITGQLRNQGYTDAEIAPFLQSFMSKNFPTASAEMIEAQLKLVPDAEKLSNYIGKAGGGNTYVNGGSNARGSTGDANYIRNQERYDAELQAMSKSGSRSSWLPDFGDKDNYEDALRNGIEKVAQTYAADGLEPMYVANAIRTMTRNKTLPADFDLQNLTPEQTELLAESAFNIQNRARNAGAPGSASGNGGLAGQSLEDLQKYVNNVNAARQSQINSIMGTATPKQVSAADRQKVLLDDERRKRYGYVGKAPKPGTKEDEVQTAMDKVLNVTDDKKGLLTGGSGVPTATTSTSGSETDEFFEGEQRLFPGGGDESGLSDIPNTIPTPTTNPNLSPKGRQLFGDILQFDDKVPVVEDELGGYENPGLTPQTIKAREDRRLLSQQNKAEELRANAAKSRFLTRTTNVNKATAANSLDGKAKLNAIYDVIGTGTARTNFLKSLTPQEEVIYERAISRRTSKADAVRLLRQLKQARNR